MRWWSRRVRRSSCHCWSWRDQAPPWLAVIGCEPSALTGTASFTSLTPRLPVFEMGAIKVPSVHQELKADAVRRWVSPGILYTVVCSDWEPPVVVEPMANGSLRVGSGDKMAVNPALLETEKPEDLQLLRAFLGVVNYYCRFTPRLASVAAPCFIFGRRRRLGVGHRAKGNCGSC